MDFNMRRKQQTNLKPLSRKQNYLSNLRADSPTVRNRNSLQSGNVQVKLGANGPSSNNAYFAYEKGEEGSEFPKLHMVRSISQVDKEYIANSKKFIDDIHNKLQRVPTTSDKSIPMNEEEIRGEIEVTYNGINELFTNLSYSKSKREAVKLLLEKIETILGFKEANIIDETMKKLLTKELLKDETKIYIGSRCLTTSLTIIKFFNKKEISSQLMINPFIIMNDVNKGILQYLKSKYPRNKNLFVPAQLQSKFDQVNYLSLHQYNMLVNTGITFTNKNANRAQILGKTKRFINLLLDQLDNHFHEFEELLNEKVLKLSDGIDIKLNKIKIGRKIPQNTEKFYEFKSQNMQISSPQLFRVMIKWIGEMEELLTNPSKVISKRSSIKYIKKIFGQNVTFDEIQSKRFQDMKIQIIEKIASMKEFKNKIDQLIQKLNTFNNNFARTLDSRTPSTKFIKEQQAETLKFAKYNTLFLEWLIVEKFLIIIKTLSQLSAFFEGKYYKKLDFINFNVFDLMRGCFSGKKKQIFEVFQNLKRLDKEKQIQLVRIKNRLNTPLNDVMINFKMKDSFIICELQLILVDILQEGQEKLKVMQDLNHIIYELERSPYGSLSQMALIMGYYDPTIYYESKIKFKGQWENKHICRTGKEHEFFQIKDQQTPFVCSWCVKFYGRFVNFFEYHQCVNCSLQKCKSCVFSQNQNEQKRIYYKYFASCHLHISLETIDNEKDDDFIDNFFIRQESLFISDKYQKLRDHIQIDGKSRIDQIETLLYHKQSQYGLSATQPFYALLLHFKNGQYNLRVLKYVNYQVQICSQKKFYEKAFRLEEHDAIFFFRKRVYYGNSKESETFMERISTTNTGKMYDVIDNSIVKPYKRKNFEIVYISHHKKKYVLEWVKVGHDYNSDNARAISRVLDKKIQICENYKAERNCLQFPNLNMKQIYLKKLSSKEWVEDIRVLNLARNHITDISLIVKNFANLKELYLGRNTIKNIQIPAQSQLQVLDVSSNELLELPESINNAKKLLVLKASMNYISTYPLFSLTNLEEIDLSLNQIKNVKKLLSSKIRNLQILNISFNQIENEDINWSEVKNWPKLKRLEANKVNLNIQESLQLKNFRNLQYIDFSRNKISSIETFIQKKLREVKLFQCNILSLKNVFTDKLIHLQILQIYSNEIEEFPPLDLNDLQVLKMSNNRFKNIENIKNSYLPKLKTLDIQYNQLQHVDELGLAELPNLKILLLKYNKIKRLPALNLPQIQIINLVQNKIEDISKMEESHLPQLKQFLVKQNKIEMMPLFNFESLRELNPSENQIKNLDNFRKSIFINVKKLAFWKNKITQIPPLNFPTIENMLLFQNQITSINGLSESVLENVSVISLYDNKIESLPVIKFPSLQKFYIYKNKLENIENLQKWDTPSLRVLDMNSNKVKKIPPLYLQNLTQLELSYNKIESLKEFCENSSLPNLRKLFINANTELKQIQNLDNFFKLEEIQLNNCSLESFHQLAKSKLKFLRKLSLEGNKITQIPKIQLPQLEELILRNNLILQVKQTFLNAKKLKKLHLQNNKIKAITAEPFEDCFIAEISFSRNPIEQVILPQSLSLRLLSIKECKLKNLDGLYLPNLRQLYLKGNELESLQFLNQPGAFAGLKKVYAEQNKIKSLPALDLPELTDLILYNNPIEEVKQVLGSLLPNIKKLFLYRSKVKSQKTISDREIQKKIRFVESEEEEESEDQEEEVESMKNIPFPDTGSKKVETQREELESQFKEAFPKTSIKIW